MGNRRALIPLMIVAFFVVDLIVMNRMASLAAKFDPGGILKDQERTKMQIFEMVFLSQIALTSLWLGLGRSRLEGRLLLTVATIVFCQSVWPAAMGRNSEAMYAWYALPAAWIASLGLLMRVLGWRLADVYAPPSDTASTGLQWSIAENLTLLFAAALVLVVVRISQPDPEAIGVFAMWAGYVVAAAWFVLAVGMRARLIALAIAVGSLVFFLRMTNMSNIELVAAALIVAGLLVVRLCGFRLVWKPIVAESLTPVESTPSDETRLTVVSPDGEP